MNRPEILDLFCCSGGAGAGYAEAGFRVTGVDIVDRPRYPFTFVQADALEYLHRITVSGEVQRYSLIHASPPCQSKCGLTAGTNASRGWGGDHVDLVAPTRELLLATGLPHVIEQPNGKAEIRKDLSLCGEMFGLGVLRHRNFELGGWRVIRPTHPKHRGYVRGWRHGVYRDGPYVAAYGDGGGKATEEEMQRAMGITWTAEREELTEAIPPAYTEWIGRAFLNRKDDMSETAEKPRGACTGCKFEYQLGQGKGKYKGMLVVRKHLSRTGPGECDGSRKPPAIELGEATGDADAWQSPGKVAEPAPVGEQRDGVPSVFYASYDTDMAECGHPITEGDLIQSDGEGGWRCSDCIVEPEATDVCACGGGAEGCPNCTVPDQPLPHDRGAHPETVAHIPGGHDFTDSTGATWRHGGTFDDCTTVECVQFRNRLNPPVIARLGSPEHACDQGVFMLLRNCPVHGVQTPVAPVTSNGVPLGPVTLEERVAAAPTAREIVDGWSAPGPASAAELPPVHGQPEPKRDRWGRYVFNGTSHTRATTFAKSASSTHALSEWRERMVVLGLTMRRDLLAMAHGKHVKRDRTELNSIATQAKDAAGVKVAANLGTAYHAFSERLDAGLMTLAEVPEEYRPRLAEYQQAIAAHGLVTRPEWIERSTAVRADQVAAELPVGGTLDRIFQLPNGELVIGDLKTGSDLSYGWGEIAVQLALYAHGVNTHGLFDWNTDTWTPAPGRINIEYGIVIHLPADGSGCTLYRIDLKAGWRRAQVCGQVMAMQKSKDKLATEMFPEPGKAPRTPVVGMLSDSAYRVTPVDPPVTGPAVIGLPMGGGTHLSARGPQVAPPTGLTEPAIMSHVIDNGPSFVPQPPIKSGHLIKGLAIVGTETQIDGLGAVLGHARESGVFTEAELAELKAACAARWQELQGA